MLGDPKHKSFHGVAKAVILIGALGFAIGLMEWFFNLTGAWTFAFPMGKVLASTAVIALGYIVLELELMRKNK